MKWLTYKPPNDVNTEGLEGELEDSLSCPDCLPLCKSVTYSVQSSTVTISNKPERRPKRGILQVIFLLYFVNLLISNYHN